MPILVIHHLTTDNKKRTMCEIYRVLHPDGELHIVDFGKPHQAYARLISHVMRRLEQAADNFQGLLPGMIHDAGFQKVHEPVRYATLFGDLSLYWARK